MTTESRHAERKRVRTHLDVRPSDYGYLATEPAADNNVFGIGKTPAEAAANYCLAFRDDQSRGGSDD
jgi:hypothetical protein